jgi:hypothetical protein
MAESKSDGIFGVGCLTVVAIGAVWWFWYTFFWAPSHRDTRGPPPAVKLEHQSDTETTNATARQTPEEAVRLALAEALSDAVPRLEFLQGGNLDIYLTRHEFEVVPYPDHSDVVQRIGEAWCKKVEHTYLPVVRLRDIRTGEEFGSFSCTTGHVSIREHH